MMELQPPAAALTAVILITICSTAEPDDVRLVDGSGRCDGAVEVLYNGKWWKVNGDDWTRIEAAVVCRELDCGSAVTATRRKAESKESGFFVDCKGSESVLSDCSLMGVSGSFPHAVSECSDSVRLVDGAGRCSGRLEVKAHQSWTTVCEAGFDWQDAEVVCRELDCGPPVSLQGTLFGEGKLPFGTKEFQCKGTENHLLNCSSSDREENTCTRGKAVGLTCSEVRLVDGSSRCAGTVEVFHYGDWRRVRRAGWSRTQSAVVCRQLDCGSAVAAKAREPEGDEDKQGVFTFCDGSESAVSECRISNYSGPSADVVSTCSESVRLVDGAGLCSGRLEVNSHQSWTTICEAGFDWQDAEVVCRELNCGTPLTLQGALFGEGKLPFWTKEFQCKGTENRLLTCSTSSREENVCTGGKAVGLTCSGPDDVRLVEEGSRCAGTVEMFYSGEWRKVNGYDWSLNKTGVVCRQLGCGSAVAATRREPEKNLPEWDPQPDCKGSETALRECGIGLMSYPRDRISVICSDSLSSTIINIKLLVFFVMLFLMLIICLSIFLIFKTRGCFFIRNTPGAVQKTVSLQSRAEEQQNVDKGAGEKLPIDLEQVVNEKQDRN
ncbi:hypothetical protein MHYP_G00250690 [Metynnis hypsauchen]